MLVSPSSLGHRGGVSMTEAAERGASGLFQRGGAAGQSRRTRPILHLLYRSLDFLGSLRRNPLGPGCFVVLKIIFCAVLAGSLVVDHPGEKLVGFLGGDLALLQIFEGVTGTVCELLG